MRSRLALVVPWLSALACAHTVPRTSGAPATPASAEAEREVVRTVERMFEGMRTRDTTLLREVLAPDIVMVAVREVDGATPAVRRQAIPGFLRAVATSTDEFRERIWSPEVRIDGGVATLWAPYDFHLGDRFSHCGHDAFHLAHTDGRWIVTAVTYTVRTARCTGPAAGD